MGVSRVKHGKAWARAKVKITFKVKRREELVM